MSVQHVKELVTNNTKFAETWRAPLCMSQMRERFDDPVIVLTCMDPRVVPEQFLGPRAIFAALRNAGGRVGPDVIRSICTLQSLAYKAESVGVMVVHHTDCGMAYLTDDMIKHDLHNRGAEDVNNIDFRCFTEGNLKQTVLEDVKMLKTSKVLKNIDVRGFILDTETGLLKEI